MQKKEKEGFIIIIATIVAAVILVIGSGIIGISVRDLKLVRLQEKSMIAFYAADTGLDCALDLDFRPQLDPPCTNIATPVSPHVPGAVLCGPVEQHRCIRNDPDGNINRTVTTIVGTQNVVPWGYTTVLTANSNGYIMLNNSSCFRVTVTKMVEIIGGVPQESTKIVSRGSSYCLNDGGAGVDDGVAERELILEWR